MDPILNNRTDEHLIHRIMRFVTDDDKTDHVPQPMFVIGSDGAGKSTLLRQLISYLEKNGWAGRFTVLDGKQIFSSADVIRAIEGPDYDLGLNTKEDNPSERRIIIIDDLDFFFNRSSFEDQYLLRNYLNRDNAPLLLGTLSKVGDSLGDYQAPFFEGVRLIYIPPIDHTIVDSIRISDARKRRVARLLEYLPATMLSLRIAVEIVTLSKSEDQDIHDLIKRVTPLYRYKFGNMSVYTQKILQGLSGLSAPANLSELRDITGLPSGTLSTYLRQLTESGEVRKTSPERGAPYEMTDKLFKLWLHHKSL